MNQRNWIALSILAVVVIVFCAILWGLFVNRSEPPGATGSISGAQSPSATPVTPDTPGRSP